MKRILFFFLLSCLISTAATPFTNNYNYSDSQKVAATTVAAIGRFVGLYSQLAELSYELRLADRATSIAQLQTSLEGARRLQREGSAQDGSVLRQTEKQITEYQEECQQLEKSLTRNGKLAAGCVALAEVASLGNNMTEKALIGVERLCLAQTLPTELRATRLEERRFFIVLDTLLQIGRSFLNGKTRNLPGTEEDTLIRQRKVFMIVTGVQRLLHMIHTWRKWHGFGNMPKLVRLSFLVQIVTFGIGFFLPYRDLNNDIWPETQFALTASDQQIINDIQSTQVVCGVNNDLNCPTCLTSIHGGGPVVYRAECEQPHYTHKECEDGWINANPDGGCQVCRASGNPQRAAMTPPHVGQAQQARIDRRLSEIQEQSSSIFVRNCQIVRLLKPTWLRDRSPLQERIADLSRGTSGAPIDPAAVSSPVPAPSVAPNTST